MEVYKKIKNLRETKKLSQEYLAHELTLDQSQYSRRENGEIDFSTNEIKQLAKLLETSVANLFGEETTNFSVTTQNGGIFGQYVTTSEKLIEQYEIRLAQLELSLKEKDDLIALLKLTK